MTKTQVIKALQESIDFKINDLQIVWRGKWCSYDATAFSFKIKDFQIVLHFAATGTLL